MAFKVAVASGKGGTGKTTVSVNLFHYMHKNVCKDIQLVDCDVEEPNDAIFFPDIKIGAEKEITQLIPEIDNSQCTYCRKCADYCEFNAIVVLPPIQFAEINASLCHSCGACSFACEYNAISEKPVPIGKVTFFDTGFGNGLLEGKLKIGSAMQTLLIKESKNLVPQNNKMVLYDAPPGTSCPVVETVADVDYVILVTEPTPFGLHDLTLMVDLLKEIQKPFGVIVNKAGLGNNAIYEYLHKENIELIGEIPFNQEYAARYAKGSLLEEIPQEMEECYLKITQDLERRMTDYEGNNNLKW
ncbi:MAG: ATP-binding protein [Marinilabiliaceae bacterium]|nr:ATP-binding protein [Marinilabiliaceae bacterium]